MNFVNVYNTLPDYARSLESAQEFKHELTTIIKRKIRHDHDDWEKKCPHVDSMWTGVFLCHYHKYLSRPLFTASIFHDV